MKERSSVPGVYWDKGHKQWRAYTTRNDGNRTFLGMRKTMEEAEALRLNADRGILPTAEEKRSRVHDKMARIRMRSVWRDLLADHGWMSFDHFLATVDLRPEGKRLVAKDQTVMIGPNNFCWIDVEFNFATREGKNAYLRAHRAANLELYRDKQLQRDFGITLAEYTTLLDEQGGGCAICSQPETTIRANKILPLTVDHDHANGAPRGLLCRACNMAVGQLRDNPELMRKAAAYIEHWREVHNKPLPDNVVPLKG